MKKQDKYYKIWGEHVDIKHLILSILVNILSVSFALIITIGESFQIRLLLGLLFILVAAAANSLMFKPKRIIVKEEKAE